MVSVFCQQLQELLLRVYADPTGVDKHLFSGFDLTLNDFQHGFFLLAEFIEAARVIRGDDLRTRFRVQDRRLVVRLVGIDRQEIQISGEDLLRDLPIIPQDFHQLILDPFIFLFHLRRHVQRDGDLLVVRQRLAHVRKGQEGCLLQQEAGIDERRHAGELPRSGVGDRAAPVGGVVRIGFLKPLFHNAVLGIEVVGRAKGLSVQQHLRGHRPVEQMKDAGGVAVDECGRHANDLLRNEEDFAHGVALTAVVVVLVKLIEDRAVDLSLVHPLDV